MRGWMLLALCTAPAWAGAYTSVRSGNWSDPAVWSPAGVPGDGDTVSIANGHTVAVDRDLSVGASLNGYFSYISGISVADGKSGLAGACSATVTGGSPNGYQQGLECEFADGALAAVHLATTHRYYGAASAQPTITIHCGGAPCDPQPELAVAWHQGSGVPAIHLNASGQLVIGAGRTLRVKGTILYTGGLANTTDGIVYQPGGRLVFDSSEAAALANGAKPTYSYGQSSPGGQRAINATACTAEQRCGLSSTNGYAQLSAHSFVSFGLPVRLHFMDIENLGREEIPWFDGPMGYVSSPLDIRYCRISNCSFLVNPPVLGADMELTLLYNTWSGTKTSSILSWHSAHVPMSGGAREISGNVFDVALFGTGALPGSLQDFTIANNYFGEHPAIIDTGAYASFRGNFLRTAWDQPRVAISNPAYDSYVLIDRSGWIEPRVLSIVGREGNGLHGWIFGNGDSNAGGWGVAVQAYHTGSPVNLYVRDSILLPAASGYGWGQFTSVGASTSGTRLHLEHNTWFGGSVEGTGSGMLQMNDGSPSLTGNVPSMRGNIIWNPHLEGYMPAGFMKASTGIHGSLHPDVCSACDYNLGWNHRETQPSCTNCENQGNGYAGRWSETPGTHDLNVNPQFSDWQRTVELFDSKYLGNSYTAWSPGGSYAYGDFTTSLDAAVYWGLPVNYRCIAPDGCTGAPKPGVPGTEWRRWWEWASLYRLRENLGANYRVFPVDGAVAAAMPVTCTPEENNILCVMMAWVRQGYIPWHYRLYGASHDGRDTGSVTMPPRRFFPPVEF